MSDRRTGTKGRDSGQPQNIVGPQVRRLRVHQRLTQPQLAARCQVVGYDLSRESLAKVEGGIRTVTDVEVILLARALRVPHALLYPTDEEMAVRLKPILTSPPPLA